MSIRIAVIPVAGLGTRLLPATKSQPKEMLPVAKKPVVQYVVEELEANGMKQILLVTGKNKTSIENHFDFDHELMRNLRETGKEELLPELEYERMRLQFFFTRQRKQKGLGDAILCGQHFTEDKPFVVALGDSILGLHGLSQAVGKLIEIYEENQAACVIAVEEVAPEDVGAYGIVEPDGDGEVFKLLDLVEKPSPKEAPSNLAIAARYVFSPAIYDAINETVPDGSGEVQLTDAIRLLLRGGERIMALRLPAKDRRYDIGNFGSYFEAFLDFALADPELGPGFRKLMEERIR
jgi:UTP--glucose-1-phosphate uridylyltransferase